MSPDACSADTPTGIPWFVARKKKERKKKKGKLSTSNEKVLLLPLFLSPSRTMIGR